MRESRIQQLGALAVACAVMPLAPASFGGELGPQGIVLVLGFLILSLTIHEVAHAWVALKCGDTTARDLGRITLNPIPHIDLMFTVIVPALLLFSSGGAFVFGGAKPVPVTPSRLRHPLRDMMFVAIAGPLSNLLLAILAAVAFRFALEGFYPGAAGNPSDRLDQLLPRVVLNTLQLNVLLAVFNMLPLPPLDGSRVMAWLLPPGIREPYVQLERFGILLVVLVVYFVPGVNPSINAAMNAIMRGLFQLTGVQ